MRPSTGHKIVWCICFLIFVVFVIKHPDIMKNIDEGVVYSERGFVESIECRVVYKHDRLTVNKGLQSEFTLELSRQKLCPRIPSVKLQSSVYVIEKIPAISSDTAGVIIDDVVLYDSQRYKSNRKLNLTLSMFVPLSLAFILSLVNLYGKRVKRSKYFLS